MTRDQIRDRRRHGRSVHIEEQPGQRRRDRDQGEMTHRGQQDEAGRRADHPDHQRRSTTEPVRQVAADDLRHKRTRAEAGQHHTDRCRRQVARPGQIQREKRHDDKTDPVDERADHQVPERTRQVGRHA
jgi:hypothetical protein